jgi:hypothetical protein
MKLGEGSVFTKDKFITIDPQTLGIPEQNRISFVMSNECNTNINNSDYVVLLQYRIETSEVQGGWASQIFNRMELYPLKFRCCKGRRELGLSRLVKVWLCLAAFDVSNRKWEFYKEILPSKRKRRKNEYGIFVKELPDQHVCLSVYLPVSFDQISVKFYPNSNIPLVDVVSHNPKSKAHVIFYDAKIEAEIIEPEKYGADIKINVDAIRDGDYIVDCRFSLNLHLFTKWTKHTNTMPTSIPTSIQSQHYPHQQYLQQQYLYQTTEHQQHNYNVLHTTFANTEISRVNTTQASSRLYLDNVPASLGSWRQSRHDILAKRGSSGLCPDDVWASPTSSAPIFTTKIPTNTTNAFTTNALSYEMSTSTTIMSPASSTMTMKTTTTSMASDKSDYGYGISVKDIQKSNVCFFLCMPNPFDRMAVMFYPITGFPPWQEFINPNYKTGTYLITQRQRIQCTQISNEKYVAEIRVDVEGLMDNETYVVAACYFDKFHMFTTWTKPVSYGISQSIPTIITTTTTTTTTTITTTTNTTNTTTQLYNAQNYNNVNYQSILQNPPLPQLPIQLPQHLLLPLPIVQLVPLHLRQQPPLQHKQALQQLPLPLPLQQLSQQLQPYLLRQLQQPQPQQQLYPHLQPHQLPQPQLYPHLQRYQLSQPQPQPQQPQLQPQPQQQPPQPQPQQPPQF